jgi:WD40 repeat protein
VTISPDGRTLASASGDGTVKVWEAQPPRDRQTIRLDHCLVDLQLGADDKTLATLEQDGTFSLWGTSPPTLRSRRMIDAMALDRRDSGVVVTLREIGRDLRTLLIADSGGAVGLWDAERGRQVASLGERDGAVGHVGLSPDGTHAFIVRGNFRWEYWDLTERRLVRRLEGTYGAARTRLLLDRSRLVINTDREDVLIWEPLPNTLREHPHVHFWPACVGSSPNRGVLAFQNGWEGHVGNRKVHVYDTERWIPITTPIRSPVDLSSLAVSPDGRTLACGGVDGKVRLCDVASGLELLALNTGADPVAGVEFSSDGKTLVAFFRRGDGSTEIVLWHAADFEVDRDESH